MTIKLISTWRLRRILRARAVASANVALSRARIDRQSDHGLRRRKMICDRRCNLGGFDLDDMDCCRSVNTFLGAKSHDQLSEITFVPLRLFCALPRPHVSAPCLKVRRRPIERYISPVHKFLWAVIKRILEPRNGYTSLEV